MSTTHTESRKISLAICTISRSSARGPSAAATLAGGDAVLQGYRQQRHHEASASASPRGFRQSRGGPSTATLATGETRDVA